MSFWQETFGRAQSRWQLAGWMLAFAFPVLALVVDKAASTIFALFFLAGLWLLVRGPRPEISRELRWVLIAFAAYFIVGVLSYTLGEQTRLGEKLLGRDIRFVAAVPAAFVLVRVGLPIRLVAIGFPLAGVTVGLIALAQALDPQDAFRATGETISIVFGHLAASLFAINLAMRHQRSSRGSLRIALVGALFAAGAAFLSATRGAVLVVLLTFLFFSFFMMRHSLTRLLRLATFSIVFILAVLALPTGKLLLERFESVQGELSENVSRRDWISDLSRVGECADDSSFLEWILRNSLVGGEGSLVAGVVSGDFAPREGCGVESFVELGNTSPMYNAWIYFPTRNVGRRYSDGGSLLVSGRGCIGLGGLPDETQKCIDSTEFVRIHLSGLPGNNQRHLFVLQPGQTLKVIPIFSSRFEYAYPEMSSSAIRLAMWLSARDEFLSSPLLGHGAGSYPKFMTDRAEQGLAAWQLTRFDHAHNEILTVAAERGLVGLIALFGVYAAPFWLFWRRRDVFGYAGMAFVASIFLSGLTETIFNHSLGITYYCMFVLLLAVAPRESSAVAPEASSQSASR